MSEAQRWSRDRAHARVYVEWKKLPAWRTLSGNARALFVEILMDYHPDRPNAFALSNGTIAELMGCTEKTAAKLINELVLRGWLFIERRGAVTGMRATRARVVSIAKYETESRDACEPFRHWRPAKSEGDKR